MLRWSLYARKIDGNALGNSYKERKEQDRQREQLNGHPVGGITLRSYPQMRQVVWPLCRHNDCGCWLSQEGT